MKTSHNRLLILFLSTLFFTTQISSEEQKGEGLKPLGTCEGQAWPFSRTHSDRKSLYKIFKATNREKLVHFTFYEMYEAPKNHLLMPMLHYLETTEKNRDLKSFFEVMGHLASKKRSTPIRAMQEWPKRVTIFPMKKAKADICKLYEQALNSVAP